MNSNSFENHGMLIDCGHPLIEMHLWMCFSKLPKLEVHNCSSSKQQRHHIPKTPVIFFKTKITTLPPRAGPPSLICPFDGSGCALGADKD